MQVNYKAPAVAFIVSVLILILGLILSKHIKYNCTSSEPIGWYFTIDSSIKIGALYTIKSNNKIAIKLGFNAKKESLLKRVVAGKGDVVEVKNSGILINGTLQKNSKSLKTFHQISLNPLPIGYKHILQKDEYFVMGNGAYSFDSRYFGVVKKISIQKRAFLIFRR